MLIVGPSGCGKTTLLMRFILENNLLNYDKLYVFSKSLYQPEYQCLIEGFKNHLPKENISELLNLAVGIKKLNSTIAEAALGMRVILENEDKPLSPIQAEFHDKAEDIPDPTELDMTKRNLIVFDDIMMDNKQTTAAKYYTQSRSANCDCIYLSQNYTRLPLHSVRSNANFLIFFKSPNRVVEQLHRDFSGIDMKYAEFKKICELAWNEKFKFLIIDLSKDSDIFRYTLEIRF
jgi:GTPase SAR1 family protein